MRANHEPLLLFYSVDISLSNLASLHHQHVIKIMELADDLSKLLGRNFVTLLATLKLCTVMLIIIGI